MRSSRTCSRSEGQPGRGRLLGVVCCCWIALPLAAAAQMGNPAFMSPDTGVDAQGMPAPDWKNADDILFVRLVGEGGLAEVSLGELASTKAASGEVKAFGERMAAEHGAANENLTDAAEAAGIAVPSDLNAEHADMRRDLEAMDAAAFDIGYMRAQVVDHQKTAQLLEWEINNGQNAGLQRFAAANLPAVLEHLSIARGIVERLSQAQLAGVPPKPRP